MSKRTSSLSSFAGWAVGIAAFIASRAYPAIGFICLIIIVVGVIATYYARWYTKTASTKGHASEKWLKILFWSNVLTWLLPPLGMFTSVATLNINNENHGPDNSKFALIAWIGLGLSVVNALVGVILAINK